VIGGIAAKHGKTPAQCLLRWNVQRDVGVVVKSTSPARIVENLDVLNWALGADDVAAIDALNENKRFNDPGDFCVGMGGAIPIYC
jgi:diketogulonate reductase-like aldo/keto reductase